MKDCEAIDVKTFRTLLDDRKAKIIPEPKQADSERPNRFIKEIIGPRVLEMEVEEKAIGKAFFVKGQCVSWKNCHQILRRNLSTAEYIKENKNRKADPRFTKRFRYFIGKSEIAQNYEEKTKQQYLDLAEDFRQVTAGIRPIIVEVCFVNRTRRLKWDFMNYAQGVADMMVRSGWLADDSIGDLVMLPPLTGDLWLYSQESPGVLITVLNLKVKRV